MCLCRRIFLLFLLPSVLTSLQAQSATPHPDNPGTTVKATVQRVLLDVVVTNDKGEPVSGLHQKDFEVFEDGKPQRIATFEEHYGAPLTEIKMPPLPPHIYTNFPLTKTADSVNVILLDLLNTQMPDQAYVHSQVIKYLKTIPPVTRVAVFTLSSRLRMLQAVTTDSSEVLAAINSAEGLMHPSPVLTSEEEAEALHHMIDFQASSQPGLQNPKDAELDGANALKELLTEAATLQTAARVDMTLHALQQLTRYLNSVPGRKNVIWFSGSFPTTIFPRGDLPNPFVGLADFGREVRKTVDLLSAGQVSLYPVYAAGLAPDTTFEANGEVIGSTRPSGAIQDLATQMQTERMDRNQNNETMDELAKDTGGKAYYNTNSLGDALDRVIRNGTHYYSLTYSPSNANMDGRYRHIRVELPKRKDTLAYRRGYYADDLAAALAAGAEPDADPLIPLVGRNMPNYSQILYKVLVRPVTPQPPTDAPHIGSNRDLKGPITRYGVDFAIAVSDLKLDAAPDGTRHGNIEIGLVAYDREGKPLNLVMTKGEVSLQPNEYAALQKGGLQIHKEIDVPAGGYVYLRTGIYDMGSSTAGTLGVRLADATEHATK